MRRSWSIGERELPRILEQGLGRLDYYSEYIDQARFSDQAYQQAFRDFLLLKYQNVRFDAVIAVQDAALELVNDVTKPVVSRRAHCLFRLWPSERPHRKRHRPGRRPDLHATRSPWSPTCSHRFARSLSSAARRRATWSTSIWRGGNSGRSRPGSRLPTSMACRLPNSSPAFRACRLTPPSITCWSIATAAARTFIRSSICRV